MNLYVMWKSMSVWPTLQVKITRRKNGREQAGILKPSEPHSPLESTGDISHKPGGRLPLLSTRPTVTFPVKEITPWPVPNCTAWWQRHTGVSSLPKAITQQTYVNYNCNGNSIGIKLQLTDVIVIVIDKFWAQLQVTVIVIVNCVIVIAITIRTFVSNLLIYCVY